ncbi:MAG: alpha/beta hydrolase-fold protein [Tepidisphaeraceae bacterium]
MLRFARSFAICLALAWTLSSGMALSSAAKDRKSHIEPPPETGFLNRSIELNGVSYRFQVYLPEDWRRGDGRLWPIVLFLHGRGERGSDGMWQTQIGLPQAVRDHPERWPFVIVMPQCPQGHYWTDPGSQDLAMAALDRETAEFHGDPDRTYLSGLSLGGYGAWELARLYPHRWAAVAIAAGGVFWSYAPERWNQSATLPAEYAHALGRTPIWLFQGTDDPVVAPRQSELMYDAFKGAGGHIRLWLYQGLKHDCWTRAYNEPELPRWLLERHLEPPPSAKAGRAVGKETEPPALAERLVIPLHPPAVRLTQAQVDNLVGEYLEPNGVAALSISAQGEHLYGKDRYGQVAELGAESPTELFHLGGSSFTRLIAQREADGRITAIVLRDDRHEERWEKRGAPSSR